MQQRLHLQPKGKSVNWEMQCHSVHRVHWVASAKKLRSMVCHQSRPGKTFGKKTKLAWKVRRCPGMGMGPCSTMAAFQTKFKHWNLNITPSKNVYVKTIFFQVCWASSSRRYQIIEISRKMKECRSFTSTSFLCWQVSFTKLVHMQSTCSSCTASGLQASTNPGDFAQTFVVSKVVVMKLRKNIV